MGLRHWLCSLLTCNGKQNVYNQKVDEHIDRLGRQSDRLDKAAKEQRINRAVTRVAAQDFRRIIDDQVNRLRRVKGENDGNG